MAKKSTDTLESVNEELAAYEERLSKERDDYMSQIHEIERTLKRVRAKLNAGGETGGVGVSKLGLKKDDTIAASVSVLEESGPLSEEQLKEQVANRLRSEHSLSGFALRFREAMRSDTFTVDESGVRLSDRNHKAERRVAQ